MAMEEGTPLVTRPSSRTSDADLLTTASWFVEDAFLGISRPHPVRTAFASRMYTLHADMHYLRGFAVALLLGLTFVEIPPWCTGDPTSPCGDPASPTTPLTFGMAWISPLHSMCIEAECLVVLLANSLVRYLYLREDFTGRHDSVAVSAMLITALLLLVVRVALPDSSYAAIARSIGAYLRMLIFAVKTRNVRHTARRVWSVVVEVQNILSLVVVFIVFFGWVATMVFQGTEEGDMYMPNIYDASWNLLVLLTTANFPDVMMPAYSKNRLAVLFFAFFLCFGLFFLLNVVLAVTFNNFSRNLKESDATHGAIRTQKLEAAFDLLCRVGGGHRDGHVTWDTMHRLFRQLNHYHRIPFIKKSKMRLLFDALDSNHDQVLGWDEFAHLCERLPLAVGHRPATPSEVQRWWPRLHASDAFAALSRWVKHKRFETAIDAILIVNTVLIVVESLPALNGDRISAAVELGVWEHVEFAFSIVYFVEMVLKVVVYGVGQYWSTMKNRFDGAITIAVLAVDVYVYLPQTSATSLVLVKVLLVARCLRLFRLIINVQQYRVFCMTWLRLLPFAKNLLAIMFCAMYVFSVAGMQWFGGSISPAVMHARFNQSTYTQANFMANNFNDLASGFVTLFELLIVNNWFVVVEGHVLVTSKATRWFFIVYYVIAVSVILNLVISSILDAFADEYQQESTKSIGLVVVQDGSTEDEVDESDEQEEKPARA